jgi:carbamoyltransferase
VSSTRERYTKNFGLVVRPDALYFPSLSRLYGSAVQLNLHAAPAYQMNVLGIHIGHDSSAALVHDGRIMADVAEERFVRIKHYSGLPIRSIECCLESQNLSMNDIDAIAIPALGIAPELNFLFGLRGERAEKPGRRTRALAYVQKLRGRAELKPPLYVRNFPASPRTEIVHIEHRLAHAASAYYTSGSREKQLIVTIDGAGDGVSIGLWRGENGTITRLESFPTSASIGWFYSNVTEALSWWHGDGEGKTMGLAPYGDHTKCEGALDRFYPKFQNGEVAEHHDLGRVGFWNENGAIQ